MLHNFEDLRGRVGSAEPKTVAVACAHDGHTLEAVLRAAQEGIAFAFRYGMDVMRETGLRLRVIRAGYANLFLSPVFRQTLATLCGADIELYNTDGALGAARGAALGAGLYASREETFASLRKIDEVRPDPADRDVLERGYARWKAELENRLGRASHGTSV